MIALGWLIFCCLAVYWCFNRQRRFNVKCTGCNKQLQPNENPCSYCGTSRPKPTPK